jgi:hypothetical protein
MNTFEALVAFTAGLLHRGLEPPSGALGCTFIFDEGPDSRGPAFSSHLGSRAHGDRNVGATGWGIRLVEEWWLAPAFHDLSRGARKASAATQALLVPDPLQISERTIRTPEAKPWRYSDSG